MLVGMGVRVVSQSMTLVLLLVAGRFLTADLFGVFVLSSIVMNFAIIQLYTGVYHYVLKEPDFEEGKRTAFSLQLLIAFLYAGAIGGAAYLVWITGSGELLAQLIAATALVPIIMIVSSWQEAVLLRNGHVKVYYGALFLSEVGGFCLALGMLFAGFGVWALVANRYFSAIAVAILLTFRAGPLPWPAFRGSHALSIFKYSAGLYGNSALSFFTAYGAEIILGAFLSTRAVGLYRMGARTATAAYDIFAQTFRVLTWQAVGRMAREARLSPALWTRLMGINISIMTFVLGSISLLALELTDILLGEEWYGMVPVLQILCWVKILSSADQIATAQLAAAGESRFLFVARALEAVLMLGALLLSVQFGMVAVALALAFPVTVYVAFIVRKLMRMTEASLGLVTAAVLPGLVIALLSLGVVYGVSRYAPFESTLAMIGMTALAGGAAYLFLAFAIVRRWTFRTLQIVSVAILPAPNTGGEVPVNS